MENSGALARLSLISLQAREPARMQNPPTRPRYFGPSPYRGLREASLPGFSILSNDRLGQRPPISSIMSRVIIHVRLFRGFQLPLFGTHKDHKEHHNRVL